VHDSSRNDGLLNNILLLLLLLLLQAWRREAAMVCMTLPEMMAYLQAHPKSGADSLLAVLFNGTLMSKDFKDGMVLQSLKPGFNVTLRRRNNT
jgi:hypothetical protein